MKVSGFTIARNVIKYNYPIMESIKSILPICDEFVVNVGDSEDGTLDFIKSIKTNKIRIIQNKWDQTKGMEVLSEQTNLALSHCKGDWAFYLQTDEVIHEHDLKKVKLVMDNSLHDKEIDALRFQWFHFYGSYYRYRIDFGWYQKQDRIIRNNGNIVSTGDAFAFKRKDDKPLRQKNTGCFVYHYGWVQPSDLMTERRVNAERIGFIELEEKDRKGDYCYGDLNRFPVYFGSHPKVMEEKIKDHALSQEDKNIIDKKFWWYPPKILNIRYKTGRRVKKKIE